MLMPLLAALGGAFLTLLFLKVRGVIGFEGITPSEFRWRDFSLVLVAGALAGIIGHYLFGWLAQALVARDGKRASARDLRTVWGVAGVPVALAFVLFLVLDVLIGGRDVYLTPREGDSLVMGWAIGSLVLALGAAAWSFLLFLKGIGITGEMRPSRSTAVVVVSGIALGVAAPLALLVVVGILSLGQFLIDLVQAVAK